MAFLWLVSFLHWKALISLPLAEAATHLFVIMVDIRSAKNILCESDDEDEGIVDMSEEDPEKINYFDLKALTERQVLNIFLGFIDNPELAFSSKWLDRVYLATNLGYSHLKKGVVGGSLWLVFKQVLNCLKEARKVCIQDHPALVPTILEFFNEIKYRAEASGVYRELMNNYRVEEVISELNRANVRYAAEVNLKCEQDRKARRKKRHNRTAKNVKDRFDYVAEPCPAKRPRPEECAEGFIELMPCAFFEQSSSEVSLKRFKADQLNQETWFIVAETEPEEGEVREFPYKEEPLQPLVTSTSISLNIFTDLPLTNFASLSQADCSQQQASRPSQPKLVQEYELDQNLSEHSVEPQEYSCPPTDVTDACPQELTPLAEDQSPSVQEPSSPQNLPSKPSPESSSPQDLPSNPPSEPSISQNLSSKPPAESSSCMDMSVMMKHIHDISASKESQLRPNDSRSAKLSKVRPDHLQQQSVQREAFSRIKQADSLADVLNAKDPSLERIVLFLDIDNTLLQCVSKAQLQSSQNCALFDIIPIHLQLTNETRYLVLRPKVKEFLERVSKFCELWVYTSGRTEYAGKVVKCLDPKGRYFGDRVISASSEEDTKAKTFSRAKQLKDFDDTMALAIDDRKDVWVQDSHCLLRSLKFSPYKDPIDPEIFMYSLSTPRFQDFQGWTKEIDGSRPQLYDLADTLEQLYISFIEKDCRFALPFLLSELRQTVLAGLLLDFSRYEERLNTSSYSLEKLMILKKVARDLGATSGSTHLYVVERPEQPDEVSGAWLIGCSFFLSNA
jgi:hypothetical protein